ncbi:hypothetical protein O181_078726 [Austropuccinia psidii MF-1]|uniref:Uncharacterized protein n=1 Tax=Austropuccinia psidii MF-1 TaxID=1389203 RepID=A0A9Q3FEV1_9BASI|nr:hypothetical protein [Austropuccinia psidii MF-1]
MPLQSGRSYSSPTFNSSDSDSVTAELAHNPDTTLPLLSDSFHTDIHSIMPQSNTDDNKSPNLPSSPTMLPSLLSFIKNPSKYTSSVPRLKSDGSNFYNWTQALDGVFMYIFNKSAFTDTLDNFNTSAEVMGALCFFLQQTISPNLVDMIQMIFLPCDAFLILRDNFKSSSCLEQLDIITELSVQPIYFLRYLLYSSVFEELAYLCQMKFKACSYKH